MNNWRIFDSNSLRFHFGFMGFFISFIFFTFRNGYYSDKNVMADQAPIPPNEPLDTKTRSNLSYMFTLGSMIMLAYILYMWGSKTEILTLIIGLIGGTLLGSVSGVYFGGGTTTKKPDNNLPVTGNNPVVNVNPTSADTTENK